MNWFGIPDRLAAARDAGLAAADGARQTASEALQHAEALVALLRAELAAYAAQQAKRAALRAVAVGCLLVAYLGLCVLAVLLLLGFALAYWLGDLLGCDALGFVVVAGIMLLLGVVFWLKRRDWITNPIARLMVMVFMSDGDKKEDGV